MAIRPLRPWRADPPMRRRSRSTPMAASTTRLRTIYVGTDAFTYKLNDGIVDGNTATVTLNVYNNPPVAYGDDDYIAASGVTLSVSAADGVTKNNSAAAGAPQGASV